MDPSELYARFRHDDPDRKKWEEVARYKCAENGIRDDRVIRRVIGAWQFFMYDMFAVYHISGRKAALTQAYYQKDLCMAYVIDEGIPVDLFPNISILDDNRTHGR
jgi:uncharacterized protein YbaR (Trm112 family)